MSGRIIKTGKRIWKWRIAVAALLVVAVFTTELSLLKIPKANAAYTVANSARFVSGNSDYLNRTFSAPTSQNVFTFSTWVKRGTLSATENIFGVSTNYSFGFTSGDVLAVTLAGTADASTTGVYRDPAQWTHVMYVQNGTAVTIYVNGVSVASGTGTNSQFNTAVAHQIGAANTSNFFDGYMADVYFIDGQALTPSSFGQTDSNGYWRPIAYTGTYGTNGFKLNFSNGSSLGTDSSSNGNNWTVNGLTASDQVLDSPTNSFATLSPLGDAASAIGSGITLSSGNLHFAGSGTVGGAVATFELPTGKWYLEYKPTTVGSASLGLAETNRSLSLNPGVDLSWWGMYWNPTNNLINNGSNPCSTGSMTASDIAQMAIDATNPASVKLWIGKDNSWFDSSCGTTGNPATGANPTNTITVNVPLYPYFADGTAAATWSANLGQGGTTTLTYSSAAGGSFYYTPPTGFKALSTNNLPVPTIAQPNKYFDAQTYAGSATPAATTTVTLTAGTSWTVPSNWNSSDNTITLYGGGSGGGGAASGNLNTGSCGVAGQPGQAGLSTAVNNFSATPGGNISYVLGAGGTGGTGGPSGKTGNPGTAGSAGSATTWASGTYSAGGGSGGAGSSGSQPCPQPGSAGATGPGPNGGSGGGGGTSSSRSVGGNGGNGNPYSSGGGGGGGGGNSLIGTSLSGGSGGGGTQGYVVITYVTPASGSQSITTFNFQPDLVWLKDRTATNNHGLFDSVEGATKYWSSNINTAETTDAQSLTSFLTNGFSLGTATAFNTSGDNYISWLWKKTPVTDGVDIKTYTGTGSATTVAHSLSAAPDLIIVKRTDTAGDPAVYDSAIATPQNNYLLLDSTAAATADSTYWNNTAPTASVFTVGTNANVNASGGTYVAYLFKGISGFSSFGSYTGNGSTDGPFVYTGFEPRFVMIKRTNSTPANWYIWDSARSTQNVVTAEFYPNLTNAEANGINDIDFLSNGFKLHNTVDAGINGSGTTFIYASFAEEPFYYSAQPAASSNSFVQAVSFLMGMPF